MNVKQIFTEILYEQLGGPLTKIEVASMIEKPKYDGMGDVAFPCFALAKIYRQSPQNIALQLIEKLTLPDVFARVEAVSGYVNVFLNQQKVSFEVVNEVLSKKSQYGNLTIGDKGVVTIDFSSPNIAKPFSMGHLRSTVIGNALALILEKCDFQPLRINHLGDWGTQFGKLMAAYQLWGDEQQVKTSPISELLKLYVRFHKETIHDDALNDRGREWFKRLENGDEEALTLWEWFREESLKEFSKLYQLLDIQFDSVQGEAFYNDKMDRVVDLLEEMNLLKESDGAEVVEVTESLPPCLIKKKDGTTLYATRDLAAAIYRHETYQSVRSLYVVGNEQTLHFQQLFLVLQKMGYAWQAGLKHVSFGMMLKNGKKMSTRQGKVVLLEDVLSDAIELAKQNMLEKNPTLADKDKIACEVGTGAVIFHDLKHHRLNDIEFSLKDMLTFEGETGPYVQYTHVRASAILKKAYYQASDAEVAITDLEGWPVVKILMGFPDAIYRAYQGYDPSQIARYVLELSKAFNHYYGSVRILNHDEYKQSRLFLVAAVQIVLKEGLRLLGIAAPEEM